MFDCRAIAATRRHAAYRFWVNRRLYGSWATASQITHGQSHSIELQGVRDACRQDTGREIGFLENGAGWFTTGDPMEAKPTCRPQSAEHATLRLRRDTVGEFFPNAP